MTPDAGWRPRLLVAVAAVLFSTGGAVIKATTLGGWQVACLRSGIAVVAVLLMLPAARRRPEPASFLVGLSYAATLVLFVLATKMTTAANAIFLQSTAPVYVLLLSPRILGEPARRRDLLFLLLLGSGLALFFVGHEAPQATAPRPVAGNVLGALSGLTWALTLVGLRFMGRREARGGPGAATAVVVGNLIACLACLPRALPFTGAGPRDVAAIAYLGVVQIGVAYVCLTLGLRHVGALPATILLFIEPVLNPIWAFLVHGERIAPLALCGGAIILTATFLKNALDLRRADA
ncbi:MAG TPA: DMT family transporter [Patescibacteria group bacterium]|nr:DMT family transporter [Patescibacteria group bacterium]